MAVVFFEGFETCGPACATDPNGVGPAAKNINAGNSPTTLAKGGLLLRGWSFGTSVSQCCLVVGRQGGSSIAYASISGTLGLQRLLAANYRRAILGFAIWAGTNTATGSMGIGFKDGTTNQVAIGINAAGQVIVTRGDMFGTTIYTGSTVSRSTWNFIEVDMTIDTAANGGGFEIWLNGVHETLQTGINTRPGTNSYFNALIMAIGGSNAAMGLDDIYMFDTTGSINNAARGVVSEIRFLTPVVDSSVQFAPSSYAFGYVSQNTLSTDNSVMGNVLNLVAVTPAVNCTIQSVGIVWNQTNSTIKMRGVIYSDASGAPGSLLSSGSEIIGCTTNVPIAMPLTTPQALTAGVQYWLGVFKDTSLSAKMARQTTLGQSKSGLTYASGPPAGPLTGMTTGLATPEIWGVCTGPANSFSLLAAYPAPIANPTSLVCEGYVSDSTAGDEDLYDTTDFSEAHAIACVQVSATMSVDTAGTRTGDVRLKSGSIDSAGTNSNLALTTTPKVLVSLFETDPATSAAWTIAGINAAKAGFKVNT